MTDNHAAMDDMAEFAVANKRNFIPQGCDQQGRHTPTISVEGCAVEDEDQSDSADKEVWPVLLGFLAAFVACATIIWSLT